MPPKKSNGLSLCDVRMTGSNARIILKNGIVRAGHVVAEWSDAIMLETMDNQTAIIYRDSIAEMWEGLGPKPQEEPEANTEQAKE